jgi:hypothetical protein
MRNVYFDCGFADIKYGAYLAVTFAPNTAMPPSGGKAIYRIVGHLQLHRGQIILLTKQLAGADLDLSLPPKR